MFFLPLLVYSARVTWRFSLQYQMSGTR